MKALFLKVFLTLSWSMQKVFNLSLNLPSFSFRVSFVVCCLFHHHFVSIFFSHSHFIITSLKQLLIEQTLYIHYNMIVQSIILTAFRKVAICTKQFKSDRMRKRVISQNRYCSFTHILHSFKSRPFLLHENEPPLFRFAHLSEMRCGEMEV